MNNAQAADMHYGYTSVPSANTAPVVGENKLADNKLVKFHPGYWGAAQPNITNEAGQTRRDNEAIQQVRFYPGFYSLPNSRGTGNEFEGS